MTDMEAARFIGRYALREELASGGMASVHLGRLVGEVGFARTVAIKRLHSHYARDPEFVAMFLDEARLVARIKHPNVVPTLDVVALEGEVAIVMEYVPGEPLSRVMMALSRRKERMPVDVAVGICLGVLEGLHAAHEAKSEDGALLGVVHRDISPQNVIVGTDGVTRVLDFGIAKAAERLQTTEDGHFKGKMSYLPPDVLTGGAVDRRADVWSTAVVLWETLVGKRLFLATDSPHSLVKRICEAEVDPPSKHGVACPPELDRVLLRALMKDPNDRYPTARDMAIALEGAVAPASSRAMGEWLAQVAAGDLERRAAMVASVERTTRAERPSAGTLQSLAAGASASSSSRHPSTPLSQTPSTPLSQTPSPLAAERELRTARTARSGRAWIAVAAAILLVALPAAGVGLRAALRRTVPTSSDPPAFAPASAFAAPASASAFAAPTSASAFAAAAAPAASASPSAPPSASAPSPKKPALPTRACTPPYTIGPPPDYIRRPKLECLGH